MPVRTLTVYNGRSLKPPPLYIFIVLAHEYSWQRWKLGRGYQTSSVIDFRLSKKGEYLIYLYRYSFHFWLAIIKIYIYIYILLSASPPPFKTSNKSKLCTFPTLVCWADDRCIFYFFNGRKCGILTSNLETGNTFKLPEFQIITVRYRLTGRSQAWALRYTCKIYITLVAKIKSVAARNEQKRT